MAMITLVALAAVAAVALVKAQMPEDIYIEDYDEFVDFFKDEIDPAYTTEEVFKALDRRADGRLDPAELKGIKKYLRKTETRESFKKKIGENVKAGETPDSVFDALDVDGDGELNEDELKEAENYLEPATLDREKFKFEFEGFIRDGWSIDEVFDALDVNKDGVLEYDEAGEDLENYIEPPPKDGGIDFASFKTKFARRLDTQYKAEDVFKMLDKNNDKELDQKEFRGMRKYVRNDL